MRTTSRIAVVSAVLGGGLLLAGPAAAQTATDCDEYPELAECVIGGGTEQPAVDNEVDESGEDTGSAGGGDTAGGDTGSGTMGSGDAGSDTTVVSGSTGGAASLPFTGGEVTLIALAGTAALGGGIALTAAGRKRSTV